MRTPRLGLGSVGDIAFLKVEGVPLGPEPLQGETPESPFLLLALRSHGFLEGIDRQCGGRAVFWKEVPPTSGLETVGVTGRNT